MVALFGSVTACGANRSGGPDATALPVDQPPASASVAAQVWSAHLGFVSWPALPATGKPAWSLDLAKTFLSGSYALPTLPDPAGRIAGVTAAGHLVAYDANGHQAWSTPLPALGGAPDPNYSTLVTELQAPGLELFAVNRAIASAASNHRIDIFDAATGRYLWSRTGSLLDPPKVIDRNRLLFELTDPSGASSVDVVDARTGAVRWHNPDIYSCEVFPGHLLCDADEATTTTAVLVDADTGTVAWHVPFPATAQSALLGFAAIVGGQAYLQNGSDTTLTAVDLATGHIVWRHALDIKEIDGVAPLDAQHVIVSGLSGSADDGWAEELESVSVSTGAATALSTSGSRGSTDAPTGGVTVIVIGGTHYLTAVDPDGTLHVRTASGAPVASAPAACPGITPSVLGDTIGCPNGDTLVLYSVPDLAHRADIPLDGANGTSIHLVGTVGVVEHSETVTGLGK